jgi:hypothetical protein
MRQIIHLKNFVLFLRVAERRKTDKENDLANEKDEKCYVYTDEKL